MANTGAMPPVKHCFVTVPNATKAEILPKGGVQESRVKTFDGGAFWGIGDVPGTPMMGILDIIPDWRERISKIHEVYRQSLLCKRLGLLD